MHRFHFETSTSSRRFTGGLSRFSYYASGSGPKWVSDS